VRVVALREASALWLDAARILFFPVARPNFAAKSFGNREFGLVKHVTAWDHPIS